VATVSETQEEAYGAKRGAMTESLRPFWKARLPCEQAGAILSPQNFERRGADG